MLSRNFTMSLSLTSDKVVSIVQLGKNLPIQNKDTVLHWGKQLGFQCNGPQGSSRPIVAFATLGEFITLPAYSGPCPSVAVILDVVMIK